MANSKQTKDSPASEPSSEFVEGTAFEKPNDAATKDGQRGGLDDHEQPGPAAPPNYERPNYEGKAAPSGKIITLGALSALAGAVVGALALAGYLYFAVFEPADPQEAERTSALASRQSETTAQLAQIRARLGAVETALTALQSESTAMQAHLSSRIDAATTTATTATTATTTNTANAESAQDQLSALTARLIALENQRAAPTAIAPALDDAPDLVPDLVPDLAGSGGQAAPGARAPLSSPRIMPELQVMPTAMPAQIGAVIVMAVLADDAAGRPLERWGPVLSAYADAMPQASGAVEDKIHDAVARTLTAVEAAPPSSAALLRDAEVMVGAMAVAANDAGENASLVARATASLSKLIKLRAVSASGDDARGQLGRFEAALARNDLGAAVAIANGWAGSRIDGLQAWQRDAAARIRLDTALADLAVVVIGALPPPFAGQAAETVN